jgi:hypothetical protein
MMLFFFFSVSSSVTNLNEAAKTHEAAKACMNIERALANAVEALCVSDPNYCLSKESGGVIDLDFTDLSGFLPRGFENDNLLGGDFYDIKVKDSHRTIGIYHSIPDGKKRYVYLHHKALKSYGTRPGCVSGDEDAQPPCDDERVFHELPTSLEFRRALK